MDSLSQIPGIGSKTLEKLKKLNINNPKDLLYHFPHRYIDFSHITEISKATINETITITGKLISFQNIFTRFHKNFQKAVVADKTGQINLLWFNQPYLSKNLKIGDTYSFAGTVSLFQNKKTIIAPEYGQYNTGKIIAVYPETRGLTSKWFRKTIQNHLPNFIQNISETLPQKIIQKYNLTNLKSSLSQIHCPSNFKSLETARNRLAIEEILSLQIKSHLTKKEWLSHPPQIILKTDKSKDQKINKLIKSLPFKLTDSQTKIWQEIKSDLINPKKITNRLIQGDVGSGKTVLAILGCFLTHLNNYLSILIAPTEILASQHFATFKKILSKAEGKIPIFLLTGNQKIDFKKVPKNAIIIATHAAIYQKEKLKNVGLLIIDEQHKFGVKQRAFLSSYLTHSLTMTATPIPRTISLTMFGNLDLSIIETLPKHRLPIKTFLVPQNKISNCYQWIQEKIIETKCQAFIVCPFIEPSENLATVKSATQEFEKLSKQIFPKLKLSLIHGKTKPKEKERIISDFQKNKINILVTTPIIEVGVDIPNASIMVIQSSDRFGLAALHQLRGRVGRGHQQSFCYLFSESTEEKSQNRLQFLTKNNNGLKIAEYDLKTRGPGEAFSIIQHGFPSLKLANLSDLDLITLGQKILEDLIKTPKFSLQSILSEPLPEENIINN